MSCWTKSIKIKIKDNKNRISLLIYITFGDSRFPAKEERCTTKYGVLKSRKNVSNFL